MVNLIDGESLSRLVQSHLPRESFGPGSEFPFFALDLSGSDKSCVDWLKDLPCPVIGIGEGALAEACDVVLKDDSGLKRITDNIEKTPLAAMILVQHLRASENLSLTDALTAESFAYATTQKGPEFTEWLAGYEPDNDKLVVPEQPLDIDIDGASINLTMNNPDNHNAIGTKMRDALCEALDMALADNSYSEISLTGAGRVFSTGGEVAEFGEISDPATAHWIRSLRLPAWRMARLTERLHIHVNGGAVGAGAEIVGFAKHVTASPDAWFQLPELKYGLIPGAGGTASLPRRIGRQRTAYLALSMKRIDAHTALDWGLVDEIMS